MTANSRGDFFHETKELYDAKSKSYWNLSSGKRHHEPAEEEDSTPLEVSPDGKWGLYADKIVSLDEAKAIGTFAGSFCGWE